MGPGVWIIACWQMVGSDKKIANLAKSCSKSSTVGGGDLVPPSG